MATVEEDLLPDEDFDPESSYRNNSDLDDRKRIIDDYLMMIRRQLGSPSEGVVEDYYAEAVEQTMIPDFADVDPESIEEEAENNHASADFVSFDGSVRETLRVTHGINFDASENVDAATVYATYITFGPAFLSNASSFVHYKAAELKMGLRLKDDVESILTNDDVTNFESFVETCYQLDQDDIHLQKLKNAAVLGDLGADQTQFHSAMENAVDGVYQNILPDLTKETIEEAESNV